MRWVRVFAAASLLATACGPFAPAEPSPTPTPSPIARSSPRPALTPRPPATPTPVPTARATPTPTAAAATLRPAPVQTARPALPFPVVNASCVEWPSDPFVFTLMTQLALPPSLCLLRATPALVGRTVCTVAGCVPVTATCAEAGSCVEVIETEHPHYVLLYFSAPSTLPPVIAEGYAMARHLCRLHQEKTRSDAALRGRTSPTWLATLEGNEFQSAFAFFRAGYPLDAARWGILPSDADNYVDVCSAWYYPSARDQRVGAYLPLLQFAQKWLPQP